MHDTMYLEGKACMQYIWANMVHDAVIHDNSAILCVVPSNMQAQVGRYGIIREKKKDDQHNYPALLTKTQEPAVTTESPSTYSNETYEKLQDNLLDVSDQIWKLFIMPTLSTI